MYEYRFKTRNELGQFLQEEICTMAEAQQILGITTQALHSLIHQSKLSPIIQRDQVTILWKSDVSHLKKELSGKTAE